ncbi:MAG TPA: heme-binding beta-barrel domain-containing protein [Acidimicrobiales bacterium]|nr:heme-binding beta-barrel domain-containing protein [Acidimicrobiales bacterium]
MSEFDAWGPLAALIGEWEGDEGLDISFNNEHGRIVETPYREKTSMKPFGPVDNGSQSLYGLDYRTAAWRGDEENPFHTEVGYWLWDAADRVVMRSFMIPRGSTILAGGEAEPDAKTFQMRAECGSEVFGILSNPFLARQARTRNYLVDITVHDDGMWTYDESTVIEHARMTDVVQHTDRNRMRQVG